MRRNFSKFTKIIGRLFDHRYFS